MPDMRDEFLFPSRPTRDKPLLGQTVLIVEDSRFASEAVRLMCLRCGARIRRADTLAAATRHLKVYRPSVAVIDLGLPDGSGVGLIRDLAQTRPRVPALLAISGDSGARDAALAAGADAFLEKPLTSLAVFLETVLARLPRESQPIGPRVVLDETVHPDRIALQDDLSHISDLLDGIGDDVNLDYVTGFLSGLGRSTGDGALTEAAVRLCALRDTGQPLGSQMSIVTAMVHERLNRRPLAI